ncbi:MAG: hypothetical protein R3227_02870 [Reinekea sp.]|nr:hypothetical protein [Reinekea sp.]
METKKLSPGERAQNWAKAIVTIWPIFIPLLGWGAYNVPAVKEALHGTPPPTVEDIQPPEKPEYYRKTIEDIITKIHVIEEQSQSDDNKNYAALARQIRELREDVNKLKELVN